VDYTKPQAGLQELRFCRKPAGYRYVYHFVQKEAADKEQVSE
jgi:hypothetical protein